MKTKYTPFTILKGTNGHVVRVRVNKPRARAGVALVLVTLALSLGLYVLASDILRLYIIPLVHKSEQELTSFVNTLQIRTEDSGFYSPITKAYAYELMHPVADVPEKTAIEIIYSVRHGDILNRLYTLESSRGTHGFQYCERQGLRNDFGMGVLNNPPMCFKTFQDEVTKVNQWFTDNEDLILAAQLCKYEDGHGLACSHAKNFMSL